MKCSTSRLLFNHPFSVTTATTICHQSLAFHPRRNRLSSHGYSSRLHSTNSVMWDPMSQTYKDGIVPSHHSALDLEKLLQCNGGKLKIFGYGSLCWHPGSDGVLSLANKVDNVDRHLVSTTAGRAIGYQRCWCQRSADHRGTTEFNGIVCTLLSDEEVNSLDRDSTKILCPSLTEGMIYTVDQDLVQDCLAELDFREKGGYARDVIDVIEDDTGSTVKALLYRGTPENPAFWKRAFFDLTYAAAIISVATGPSGRNDVYLLNLHEFLLNTAHHSPGVTKVLEDHTKDDRTGELANMIKLMQSEYKPYFLFGTGSNEHDQLLLNTNSNNVDQVNELVEILLVVPRNKQPDLSSSHEPKSIYAGGGHSALLTNAGDLYLWGWNEAGQLGKHSTIDFKSEISSSLLNPVKRLNIKVETADLGHTHTLVIEKSTGKLFAFGENGRGQVTGSCSDSYHELHTPVGLSGVCAVDVAAGLFHSGAITSEGELITWGCGRFGQCCAPTDSSSSTLARWRPPDGSKLVQVACGRRHTIVLDEHGRVWSMGSNKYGQLGRVATSDVEPKLVDGHLGQKNSGCFAIYSGWSHVVALSQNKSSANTTVYGWGRFDKGQLGFSFTQEVGGFAPRVLSFANVDLPIQSACCGAESSHLLDAFGNIYSSGWNEHGNLGLSKSCIENSTSSHWEITPSQNVVSPPSDKVRKKLIAAGGAHLIVMAA